jgi:hypothetical protein
MVSFNFEISLLIICVDKVPIGESELLKSLCDFNSSIVCLMKLGVPIFVTYMLTILLSFDTFLLLK